MKQLSLISILFLFTALVLPVIISCNKSVDFFEDEKHNDFIYSYRCGWCFGEMKLEFEGNTVDFSYAPLCDANPKQVMQVLGTEAYDDFNFEGNIEKMRQLDYISCGVCYDGCDESLCAIDGNDTVFIRFDYNDDVSSIEPFVEKLRQLRDELAIR